MRDIRFKAKRLDNGELVEGDLSHEVYRTNGDYLNYTTICTPIKNNHGETMAHTIYKVDPSTVCQFTGIYDKDNKEIFENDLIQDIQTKEVFAVVWNAVYACYSFLDERRDNIAAKNFADYPSKDFLIVGNKFDRKESTLIKQLMKKNTKGKRRWTGKE